MARMTIRRGVNQTDQIGTQFPAQLDTWHGCNRWEKSRKTRGQGCFELVMTYKAFNESLLYVTLQIFSSFLEIATAY